MKTWIGATFVALTMTVAPAIGHAGSRYENLSCETHKDGSGVCHGTLRGFRNGPDGTDAVTFHMGTAPWVPAYFTASVQNRRYSCSPDAEVLKLWPVALASSGGFEVRWNRSGECNALLLLNGSEYRDF
jgi:hypothetical protein